MSGDTNSNYNSIELVTNKSPEYIFNNFIQTFDGVKSENNSVVSAYLNTQTGTITQSGQEITFTLKGVSSIGQGPFSVRVKRFDSAADTVAVVTLKGHPLDGWRYWRAFRSAENRVVVETGAVDKPHAGPGNYIGFILAKGAQLKCWQDYLEFIKRKLGVPQGSTPQYNVVKGKWNYDKEYILFNVCGASSCN